MGAYTIVAVLFVIIGAIVLIAVTRSKSSGESYPTVSPPASSPIISSSVPTAKPLPTPVPVPERVVSKIPVSDELPGKWIHTKAKEKFIPQDTVYEYRRMAPCMLCPFCDAENNVGSTECQVCGMSFRRGV